MPMKAKVLSPQELRALAQRMVDARTKAAGKRLEAKLVDGFFGANLDAGQSASFAEALSNPTKPGAALKRAFRKYRALAVAAPITRGKPCR